MAIHISLGGNAAGDGFLVAPSSSEYDATLELWTDAGTVAATLQASPDVAGLVFSQTAVSIGTVPTHVHVHATAQSGARSRVDPEASIDLVPLKGRPGTPAAT
jgi:hypothetical protein